MRECDKGGKGWDGDEKGWAKGGGMEEDEEEVKKRSRNLLTDSPSFTKGSSLRQASSVLISLG